METKFAADYTDQKKQGSTEITAEEQTAKC